MVSELGKSLSNRKPNGTPIKMFKEQKGSPSLVARLMGLDDLPQHEPLGSASVEFIRKDHDGIYKDGKNEKNTALIREKFMEAKRLSTDEKLRKSKQFHDAIEVLNSNKDLFLKFLQEPNSLFSRHHNLPSMPPQNAKRITILKPSKFADFNKFPQDSENHCQPTRIVVLKPKGGNLNETRAVSSSPSSKTLNDDGFYADLEDNEPEESSSSDRRDETLLSSVLSNGYNGDESSFGKSEVYYTVGNLSDSEVMSLSPTSRHSWDYDRDYINHFGSPYSPESSVSREAKRRLSERWAMMSLNRSGEEQRHVRRNSSTLGEMLACDLNKKYDDTKELTIEKSQHSQFKDDDHISSCSSTAKLTKIGIDPNKYNLIDKSPPIGSISRMLALDHYAIRPVTPVLGKTSTKALSREEEEQKCLLYVQTLLSAAGNNNNRVQSDSVMSRWHSPESPLDPSLRDKYMSLTNKEPVHRCKQRNQRSFQRLVFDCVNDILTSGTCEHMGKLAMDRVWGQMKEMCDWDGDGDGGDEDGGTVAVERVVRGEVVSEVWMENLKLEIEDVKHEIEGKLVEQLVDDFVVELIGGVICC